MLNRPANVGEPEMRRIRAAQINSVMQLVPLTMSIVVGNAALVLFIFWDSSSYVFLASWASGIVLASAIALRSWARSRHNPPREASPRATRRMAIQAFALAVAWGMLPLALFQESDPTRQLIMSCLMAGMIAGGAFSLSIVPQAGIAYTWTLSLMVGTALLSTGQPIFIATAIFALIYTIFISRHMIAHGNLFLNNLKAQLELGQQTEIISLLLKEFQENASDWLWQTDADARLIYVPQRFVDVSRMPLASLLGVHFAEVLGVLCPDDGAAVAVLAEQMAKRESLQEVSVHVVVGGNPGMWSLSAKPTYDHDGTFSGYRGVGRDVTERSRAERAEQGQALARERFEIAVNNMRHGLLLFDASHRLIVCNDSYIEMYGLSPEMIQPGCSLREIVACQKQTGSFGGDVDRYCDEVLRNIAFDHVAVVGTRDGRTIRIANRPLADGGWVATHEDITDLKRREEALKIRSEQLIEAQSLGKIGDWSYRIGDRDVWWSPQIFELLRHDPATFAPTREAIISVYEGDGAARVLASQAETLRTGSTRSVDVKAKRGDGSVGDFVVTSKAMRDAGGRIIGFAGTIQDISDRKSAEEKLEKLAYFDPLTGLANRALFHRELNDVLTYCAQTGSQAALLMLDLDRFKEVNDSLGHASGDELLAKVARLISRALGNDCFIARLGGDEFAVILRDCADRTAVREMVADVLAVVSGTVQLERGEITIGTSIGIALIPSDGATTTDLQKNADLALYRAKETGRGRCVFFEPELGAAMQHKVVLARELRKAISENVGLAVHYQPQVSLLSGRVTGFEALMRWTHPTLGNVSPAEFIAVAESSQTICDLGLWILREAAVQAKAWLDAGEPAREIAVNVSAAQIWHTDFAVHVEKVLNETGLPPHLLCLELTESLLADHAEGRVRIVLLQLKRLGVTLALDDFGTDYSSLGYLTQLPFDKIKIDRIFVDGITESARARNLMGGIIALGRGLGMTIVAEGAETPDEVAILGEMRCDTVQGYVFARPAVATEALVVAQSFEGQECRVDQTLPTMLATLQGDRKTAAVAR
ncbi:EAL domain-containing protein [Bradyrhizobium sp.]|uniref:sensor domain-containing protein n=1 Tax=Bradyrhizobium sp. TaxID=376 RepID=UPI0025BA626F|nr:EAL domain-containing protein [Bradyrhizobium sp.]